MPLEEYKKVESHFSKFVVLPKNKTHIITDIMFFSNDGYKPIKIFPCRERINRAWIVEIETTEKLKETLWYCNKNQYVSEELGEYYNRRADRFFEIKPIWKLYTYFDDMRSFVIFMLCRFGRSYDPNKHVSPEKYFTIVIKKSVIFYQDRERLHRINTEELNKSIELEGGTWITYSENA